MIPIRHHQGAIDPMRFVLTLTSLFKKLDMTISTITVMLDKTVTDTDIIQQYKRYRQCQHVCHKFMLKDRLYLSCINVNPW